MSARAGSRILLTLGFLAAALAYSGWVVSRTVLDPGSTPALARAIVDTKVVHQNLSEQLTKQIDKELRARGTDPRVKAAVDEAVRDPRVIDAFADAVGRVHAALLGDGRGGTITLNPRALTAAVDSALAARAPQLAAKLSKQPPVDVHFDTGNIPNLGHARDTARTATLLGLLAALFLIAASLLLVHDRRAVGHLGRRIAYLAIFPLLLFVLVPWLAPALMGKDGEVVRAALNVYGPRVLPSAIVFVAVGIAVFVAARFVGRNLAPEPPPARVPSPPPAPSALPDEARIQERLYL